MNTLDECSYIIIQVFRFTDMKRWRTFDDWSKGEVFLWNDWPAKRRRRWIYNGRTATD